MSLWFTCFITIDYIIIYLIYYAFQKRLKEVKDSYVKFTEVYDKESKMYKEAYYSLLTEYNKAVSVIDAYKRTSSNIHINDDIKSALKFAMIHSHPDKKICEDVDEFIKFKKLYDEYK